jgi:hypothetical protein
MAGHRAQAARKRRIDHERVMFIALDEALKTSASSGARVKKVSQKVSLTSKVRQDSATAKFRKSSIYKVLNAQQSTEMTKKRFQILSPQPTMRGPG